MTSNLGTSLIAAHHTGLHAGGRRPDLREMKDRVMEEMKRAFPAEFINRYRRHHRCSTRCRCATSSRFIRLMIDKINKQLTAKGIELVLTPAAEAVSW